MLPEAEQAELEGEEVPSFASPGALGFMFVVENWAEEWAAPATRKLRSGWMPPWNSSST